jgi:hypothetical protein
MQRKRVQVVVYALYQLKNSVNGNPRYRMSTNQGDLITSSDSAFCYGLLNGWTSAHDTNGRPAQINLTRAGRVEHLDWIG